MTTGLITRLRPLKVFAALLMVLAMASGPVALSGRPA